MSTPKLFTSTLRHKVILQQKNMIADGAGGFTASWQDIATLWAEIKQLKASEKYTGGQVTPTATHIFRLRYNDDVTTGMRFSYDGRFFNIRALHNIGELSEVLDAYVEEGVAA